MQNLPSLHCHWVRRLYTSAPTYTKMTILSRRKLLVSAHNQHTAIHPR